MTFLRSSGPVAEAVSAGERASSLAIDAFGDDHPSTLGSRNNLAGAYESAGQLDKAIPLYETTLTDSQRVLGDNHPDTLTPQQPRPCVLVERTNPGSYNRNGRCGRGSYTDAEPEP